MFWSRFATTFFLVETADAVLGAPKRPAPSSSNCDSDVGGCLVGLLFAVWLVVGAIGYAVYAFVMWTMPVWNWFGENWLFTGSIGLALVLLGWVRWDMHRS